MTRRTTSASQRDPAADRAAGPGTDAGAGPGAGDEIANEVVLRGHLRRDAERRELPSGSELVTVRLVVPRKEPTASGRATSDWVDCAVWTARLQRRIGTWRADDRVEVRGALRRRFYRVGGGDKGTRLEVEVLGGRMLQRAARVVRQSGRAEGV